MKRLFQMCFLTALVVAHQSIAFSQTVYTTNVSANSSGNWNVTSSWLSGNGMPPLTTNTSTDPTTYGSIVWGSSNTTVNYPDGTSTALNSTIGSMTTGTTNANTLNIGNGTGAADYLSLGSSNLWSNGTGTAESLTANNSFTLTIYSGATLEIWGNLVVNNTLNLSVQSGGTLIIHGSVTVAANATMTVSGSVTVGGSFTVGNSANITVNSGGSVAVTGNVNAGNSSCLTLAAGPPSGIFSTKGTCSSGGGATCSSGAGGAFCSTVPITLNSFRGLVDNQSVNLNWSTSSEINFDHFVLERSANGKSFSELAQIKGSGTSNTHKDYSYTDNNPFIGNSYYRLTSVDFDGYTEVFNNNVVRVTVNAGKNFYIAPNPIEGLNLKAGINFDASSSQVVIYDRMGSVIGRYKVSDSEFELQLPNLPNGVYFAQLQSEGFTKSVRFVVNQ